MRNDTPTVYTTESGRICPQCGQPVERCVCKKTTHLIGDGVVRVRRESKGRKGKTVTLITGLPLAEEPLRALLSELKRRCGTGGALKEGMLEIQGDHRDLLVAELQRRGYAAKKAGG